MENQLWRDSKQSKEVAFSIGFVRRIHCSLINCVSLKAILRSLFWVCGTLFIFLYCITFLYFITGISEEDLLTITTTVNIVFHSAATVRFNDDLKEAGLLNSLATKVLLDLCLKIDNLKSVVYVSTAYCNPGRKYVKETVYETVNEVTRGHFLNAVQHFSKSQLNSLAQYVKVRFL